MTSKVQIKYTNFLMNFRKLRERFRSDLEKEFNYKFKPLYSVNSKEISGSAIVYNTKNVRNKNLFMINYGLYANISSYDQNSLAKIYTPFINFNFRESSNLRENKLNSLNARYLKINSENYNLKDVIKRFRRFKDNDKLFLDSISLQFSSYYFNDSLWINKDVFFNKFPEINERLKQNIVKKKLFYRLQDSLELYLINIKDFKLKNDIAPFDFIKSTLKQVLLNKKKLEFISKFEKELIEDALQQNEFEFYETNI